MSRIKRLKMKGFKSFANPTVLNFEEGFNTIVGANGSGKSNVFDALCFVLGRMSSKGLRADKLGNLVFNGGKTSKPAKEAEVAIFLSNEDKELMNVELDEIKISRIVKKTGQSTYYLNNNKATRTEIVEILKRAFIDPDGYNIILQGDIMKIVNMSPNERRELIEEIANISNYEEKRQQSLKKLDKVETDLKDADLLLEEKTKYIKELKSEKEAAEKFHKVKEDLRFNSLLLVKSKLIRNHSLKKKKEEDLEKQEETLKVHKEKLEKFEEGQNEIDNQLTDLEKSIEIKSHKDFIEVTNKITSIESEVQNLKEKKAETKKQVDEVKTRNLGVKENIKHNKEEIKKFEIKNKEFTKEKDAISKDLSVVEKELSGLKKNISSKSFEELDEIDKRIDELNDKKYNKNQIKQDNAIQIEKLNAKVEHLEEDLNKQELLSTENKEQADLLVRYRKKLKEVIVEVSKLSSENAESAAKINNLQKEYNEISSGYNKARMRAESSQDLMAQNRAVDTVLKMKSRDSSIYGSVAELASVPEKYSMALETIAGKNLFNIVVDNDSTAVKYISYLKEKRVGSVTFLPINKVKAKFRLDDNVLNKKGVIDYALNLIKFDAQFTNIFHLVFQDTIVIDKIEDAKGIGIGDYKMVTLDGDLVMKSGAMSGGFKSRKKGLGAFKDDDSVRKLESLEKRMMTIKDSLDVLKSQKEESEQKIYNLRQEKVELEGEVAKFEKILSIGGRDTSDIKSEIEMIIGDKAVIEGSLRKIDRDINTLNEEIASLQSKKNVLKGTSGEHGNIMIEITKLEEKRDILKENLMNVSSQIDTNNIQISNVLNPEIVNMQKILEEGQEAISNMEQIIRDITSQLSGLEEELKLFKSREKELSKDYKDFIEKRDKLKEDRKKIEAKYDREYEKYDKVKEKVAQLNYAINEFSNIFKNLEEELELLYGQIKIEFTAEDEHVGDEEDKKLTDLISAVDDALANRNIDVKELQNKVNNLKSRLNSFGSINLKAVQIYDQLKSEFDSLIEKRESLNVEKAEILELVAEMDEKKKEKFLETFEQLQGNFSRIFNSLSTKGDAELLLEDEKNLFENGVEIRVKMTAKNILDIKSLSGGEKTITAIAFIFAVQEFNPASFYIFDEVDAALDIMNAEKLGKLIKDYAHKAQYIVVSHSEHLIQSAETIYGVTMDKYKISDVVTLDLRDMADYVDEEAAPVK